MLRWRIAIVVAAAITISYLDRQTLLVAIGEIRKDIPISNTIKASLDYAKRMLPLLEPFHLRWLEEAVIPDDIHGYAELKRFGRIPIAGGEHEFTLLGFRELIEARAVAYIQFDTNRVGGITQARKISALAEAHSIPVIPHAGQMHNYHIAMASLNSPMAEFLPPVNVEVGNELFWYIFKGEPMAKEGFIDLDEKTPGLGLTVDEAALKKFNVTE